MTLYLFGYADWHHYVNASNVLEGVILVLLFYPSWHSFTSNRAISKNTTQLARLVSKVEPGRNAQKWDEVAFKMNDLLFRENAWKTPYCMFNGSECFHFFKKYLLSPACEGFLMPDKAGMQSGGNDAADLSVVHYMSALKGHFEKCLKEDLPEIQQEYRILPKEKYLTRLKWKKNLLSKALKEKKFVFVLLMCLLAVMITFVRIARKINALTSALISVLIYSLCEYSHYKSSIDAKFKKLGRSNRLWFLAFLRKVEPCANTERYDLIAQHMNQRLRSQEIWKSQSEYFFDGQDCIYFLKKEFLPLVRQEKKAKRYPYYELKHFVTETMDSFNAFD